jgi:hypothetical protein
MSSNITDTRTMSLVDLPLIRRLTANGTVLDSEMCLTRDARGPHSLLLSSLLFPRGIHTLIARSETQPVVGQFRYRPDDLIAHIVYLAPSLDNEIDNTVWLHILDAMAREAGKHGAHSLLAEVETSSNLFETLRMARFATYARQIIWRHEPIQIESAPEIKLEDESSNDQIGILSLLSATVPTLLQQIAAPSSEMLGLVYRKNGRIEAYIGVSEGSHGIYLLPFIHPDISVEAESILTAAMHRFERSAKVPIYVCVRSYQSWLNACMERMGFEELLEQAVMVKQIAIGIRHPNFTRVTPVTGKLKVSSNGPHYWSIAKIEPKDKEKS